MPLFDFKCTKCGKVKKDVFLFKWDEPVICCEEKMEKIPSLIVPDVFPANGIFLEHVSPEGKRFYSKQEIKEYAKAHDMIIEK